MAALDDIDGVDLDIAQMDDRIRDGLRPTAERRKRIESLRAQPNTSRPDFAQRIGCLRAGHQHRSLADSGLQEVRKMQRRFADARTVFMPQSTHASHGDVEMSELFRVVCNIGLEGAGLEVRDAWAAYKDRTG